MRNRFFFIAFLLLPTLSFSTELMPWFGKNLELEGRATYSLQSYQEVATSSRKSWQRSSNDSFCTLGLALSPLANWSGEIEATLANTHRQHSDCDHVRITGRYLLLDDVAGEDPFSLTTGITIVQAFAHSLFDVSSFHHGKIETEVHIALGKEQMCQSFWVSRWWGVLGLGIADRGSPWIRLYGAWEKNYWNFHRMRFFIESLSGFAHHNLSAPDRFKGYGSIAHRSIDVGLRYSYVFDFGAELSATYARRVYAYNFPKNVNDFSFRFLYYFGL